MIDGENMSAFVIGALVVIAVLIILYVLGKIKFESFWAGYKKEGYAVKDKRYVDLIGNSVVGLGITSVGPEYAYRMMDATNPKQYVNLSPPYSF